MLIAVAEVPWYVLAFQIFLAVVFVWFLADCVKGVVGAVRRMTHPEVHVIDRRPSNDPTRPDMDIREKVATDKLERFFRTGRD